MFGLSLRSTALLAVLVVSANFVLTQRPAQAQQPDAQTIAQRVAGLMQRATSIPRKTGKRPNVLFIITDDLGVESSGCYDVGKDPARMPNLSHLCRAGVVFENMWSAPVCSPTRATIMTGRYGFRTGIGAPVSRRGGPNLDDNELTVAEALNKNAALGYANALIGKWHLNFDPDSPRAQGWGHYAGLLGGGVRNYWAKRKTVNGATDFSERYITTELIDESIAWTRKQSDKPWFLWLAMTAPHAPFHAPPKHLHAYGDLPEIQGFRTDATTHYKAMVEAMDTEIGRLFLSLGAATLANTNIVFLGDNGTPGRVVPPPLTRRRAKGSIYQGGVHVPLFVSGPAVIDGGRRVKALANTTDLFATLLELAGVDVAKTVPSGVRHDSISLMPYLGSSAATPKRSWAYTEVFGGRSGGKRGRKKKGRRREGRAIRDADYKLIRHTDGGTEFYHLASDPHEQQNLNANGLSGAHKAAFVRLSQQMKTLLASK